MMGKVRCKECYWASHPPCGGNADKGFICSHPNGGEHDLFIKYDSTITGIKADIVVMDDIEDIKEELKKPGDILIYGYGEKSTDGLKYDLEKVDFTFLEDWDLALAELCKLSEFGAEKYSRGGWTEIPDPRRLKAAMLRHFFKEKYNTVDDDSGFLHDVATAWNALGALQIRLQNMNKNNLR